jgi:hypothetical protein
MTQDPKDPRFFPPSIIPNAPKVATPEWMRRLDVLHNKLEKTDVPYRFTIPAKDALPDNTRAVLKFRAKAIRDHFNPGNKGRIAERVTSFLAGYASVQKLTKQEIKHVFEQHMMALDGLAEWAVAAAITKALRGAVNPAFVPNASELRALADEELVAYREELRKIEHILDAKPEEGPPLSPEDRARIVDAAMAAGKLTFKGTEEEQREEAERKARQTAQNIRASQRLIEIQKKEAGITDDRPESPALRRFLVDKMGANFGGRTGIGDDDEPDRSGGGGRTE